MKDLKTFGIDRSQGRPYEEIVYALVLIYNIFDDEISQFLAQHNLTIGKFNILVAIKHHGQKGGIPQVDISKHLIVTPSNMTKLIDKLEQDGLVERLPLKGDRRVNLTRITTKGGRLLDEIWDEYLKKLKSLTISLDEKTQRQLADVLFNWFEALKNK